MAIKYERLAPMPLALNQHGMEALNGKIYVVAGEGPAVAGHSNKTYEYDPSTNAWTTMDNLPISIQSPIFRAVGDRLYCIGGQNSTLAVTYQDVYEFDPTAAAGNQWTKKADMPTAREDMASAVLGGKIYVFGGLDPNGAGAFDVLEVYDPVTNTWDQTKADLPADKLLGDFGAMLNGKVYAIGATNTFAGYPALTPIGTIYEYNAALDGWTTKASTVPIPRCYKEVAPMGRRLYIGPGCTANTTTYTASIYSYDPVNDQLSIERAAPYAARGVALAALTNGIYLSGGFDGTMHRDFYRISLGLHRMMTAQKLHGRGGLFARG